MSVIGVLGSASATTYSECLDRSYGRPAQSVAVEQQVAKKTILEVRWLPPDPNDHSKVIEPEPD